MASTLSSRNFPLNFWILPVFVVVFIFNNMLKGLIDNLGMTNIIVVTSGHNLTYLMASVESY